MILGMEIQSNIIQNNHFFISHLSRYLDPVPSSNVWKLCYRASSHGWAASTFHSRCDGKPHTVTIIRKNQYVFGGYTDIAWGMYACAIYKKSHLFNCVGEQLAKSENLVFFPFLLFLKATCINLKTRLYLHLLPGISLMKYLTLLYYNGNVIALFFIFFSGVGYRYQQV